MAGETKMITQWFPLLSHDPAFKITSPDTRNYNCIAWALGYNNKWVWPIGKVQREEDMLWSNDIEISEETDTFLKFFQTKGYEVCTDNNEPECDAIALYELDGKVKYILKKSTEG